MNEIEIVQKRLLPLIERFAIRFNVEESVGCSLSELPAFLEEFVSGDATTKFMFSNMMTPGVDLTVGGAFHTISPSECAHYYTDSDHGDLLIPLGLFIFSDDASGCPYAFCTRDRKIYHLNVSWDEYDDWRTNTLHSWNSLDEFCDYADAEAKLNFPE